MGDKSNQQSSSSFSISAVDRSPASLMVFLFSATTSSTMPRDIWSATAAAPEIKEPQDQDLLGNLDVIEPKSHYRSTCCSQSLTKSAFKGLPRATRLANPQEANITTPQPDTSSMMSRLNPKVKSQIPAHSPRFSLEILPGSSGVLPRSSGVLPRWSGSLFSPGV